MSVPVTRASGVRRAWLLIAAVLLVGLTGLRTLQVGYLSDDWALISHVFRHGNADAWTEPWMGGRQVLFYRPLFTGLYALDLDLFGADPFPAHVHNLLWHLLAVVLVGALVGRLGGGPWCAAFAALWFGVHGYLGATVGWIAARCGMVASTLTLLAVWAWMRFRSGRRRAWWYALALGAAAASTLTRESGYLALIAPLTLDLLLEGRPPFRVLVRRHTPFALLGAVLLLVRYLALGTVLGGYPVGPADPGWTFASAAGALAKAGPALLSGVPETFLGTTPPPWLPGGLAGFWPPELLVDILLGVSTVLVVLGLLAAFKPRRRARPQGRPALAAAAGLLAAQVILLGLTEAAFAVPTGQRWHAALAFTGILLALLLHPLLSRPFLRWTGVLVLLPQVLGHVCVQDGLLEADRRARHVVTTTHRRLQQAAPEVDAVFVSGLASSYKGIPHFQWGFAEALRPPFRSRPHPAPVYPVHTFMELGGYEPWPTHPPVEALALAAGEHPLALHWELRKQLEPIVARPAELAHHLGGRDGVRSFLEPRLPLEIRTRPGPGPHQVSGPPFEIPVELRAPGHASVELFCFLPAVDMRVTVPLEAGRGHVDLGRWLGEYLTFHGAPSVLYVVPVAPPRKRPGGGELRASGPLLRFRWPGP